MNSSQPYDFNGKVALITGAGSGFGAESARQFASMGASVIAVDRQADRGQAIVENLNKIQGNHSFIECDIRSVESSQKLPQEAFQKYGRLDIVVNSAGVCHFNKMTDITGEEWDEVLEIDLRSIHFISVASAELMSTEQGGRIINLSSNSARKGRPLCAHYAAAKAGVINLTESLALTYGSKGITANTVCPAVVITEMWDQNFKDLQKITGKTPEELKENWIKQTPLKRLGTAEDIANLIVFLASDRGAFITGQTINVCGGFMLTC